MLILALQLHLSKEPCLWPDAMLYFIILHAVLLFIFHLQPRLVVIMEFKRVNGGLYSWLHLVSAKVGDWISLVWSEAKRQPCL
jgi:hypothetical protein